MLYCAVDDYNNPDPETLYDDPELGNVVYTEKAAKVLIKEIVESLIVIHKKGICHKDLKPSNVLRLNPPRREDLRFIERFDRENGRVVHLNKQRAETHLKNTLKRLQEKKNPQTFTPESVNYGEIICLRNNPNCIDIKDANNAIENIENHNANYKMAYLQVKKN